MIRNLRPFLLLVSFLTVPFFFLKIFTGCSSWTKEQRNKYQSHVVSENQLLIQTTLGRLSVEFINESIVSVTFMASGKQPVDTSHAVILRPDGLSVSFKEEEDQVIFSRGNFDVIVKKAPFQLSFFKDGKEVLSESAGYFKRKQDEGFRFALNSEEKIYGAGFRTTPSNRRGQRFELYNQARYGYNLNAPNLNFSVPFVISSNGYGLLFDNAPRGWLDLDVARKNEMEFSSIGGKMTYYVIAGNDYDALLNQYGQLTGYQPMPPRWALGNIQSKFGYKTQVETEAIVDQMIAAGYSLDAIVIDLYWFGLGTHDHFYMGDLDWYKENWPEPEKMIQDFREKGVKTILITEPFILQESKNWELASAKGLMAKNEKGEPFVIQDFWFGLGGLIDIFNPEARQWFWSKYKAQNEIGVAGWWGDLGEPEKHPTDMVHTAGTAEDVHNIYSHYWHKMLSDFYAAEYPDVRLFNLNRAGFAGSQRFSVYPWSGDVSRDWDGFKAQPTAVLGMTLSGFSYMHSDLGGFARGTPDEELYLRWMQYGVFNPIYRPHGDTTAPVEPVFYSQKAQAVLKEYINLRYRMLPYNYTLAWLNSTLGTPLTRPLFFEEPDNSEIGEIDDTYLWGPNLLVAPIFERGQTSRRFYMPKGNWFDFFTNEKYTGGKWMEVPTSYENIPVYARGGSFIPLIEPIRNTEEYSSENLIVHYYFDPEILNSDFVMYEDDGRTMNAYEKGLYELLKMQAVLFDNFTLFTFSRQNDLEYQGMPSGRTIELVIHSFNKSPGNIRAGDQNIKPTASFQSFEESAPPAAWFDMENNQLTIRFNWTDPRLILQVQY
ncbi:MAG: DUF5110 domain-containing protein [Bacteroidales bacterium]|nr:DUF5110 domain-containing protein [Bacteroidales bacterium]